MEVGTLQRVVEYWLVQKMSQLKGKPLLSESATNTLCLISNLIQNKAKVLTSYGRKMPT